MNVLLFISTILLLMSMITYGRIQSYVGTMLVQGGLRQGMTELERCYYNNKIELLYRTTAVHSSDPDQETNEMGQITLPQTDENSDSTANKLINFRWLIEVQDQNAELKMQLIKNLITVLYEKEPFFQEMLKEKPDALNEILHHLSNASARVGRIGAPHKLIKLKFEDSNDESLWEFFTVLLRDIPQYKDKGCSFVSLLQYLTNRRSEKIRIYLAPKPILMAIFNNEEVVERLIKRRNEIFKEVKKQNAQQIQETARTFQETFAGEAIKFLPLLDFSVSKTDPKNYS